MRAGNVSAQAQHTQRRCQQPGFQELREPVEILPAESG